MALAKDVYREIEDILGPENISDDPAILDTYTHLGFGITGPRAKDRFGISPEAVVLPGSTKEVQAVVKLCNRRGIKFKASSTGYGAFLHAWKQRYNLNGPEAYEPHPGHR